MDQGQDLAAVARDLIASSSYLVLGTADQSGQPWVSPVWFAVEGYSEFYWVSSPKAIHSRNISARPHISIVVFDSQAPIDTGQGVYMSAVAEEVASMDVRRGIDIFSRRSLAQGGREWTLEDVSGTAPYRLYRATASEHWVLDPAAHPVRRIRVTM